MSSLKGKQIMKIDLNFARTIIPAAGLAFAVLMCGISTSAAAKDAPLGSKDFRPSPEQPVGWRGDGTGHFPGATPPMTWSLKDGKGTNIAWQVRMPLDSPSSVIAVGDKLFTTGNDFELICVEKRTGKILWVKPVSPYDAATKEDREANKELFDNLDKMAQKRDELLAKMPAVAAAAVSNEIFKLGGEITKNDSEMMKLLAASDKVKYKGPGISGEGGFMGTTPASDGALVYAWNGWGVTACFDLEGNRKWIRFDKLAWQEHGHYSSPLLSGDLVIIYVGRQYLALDKKTGKEIWRTDHKAGPGEGGWWFASPVGTVIDGKKVMVGGDGSLMTIADGGRFAKGACWHPSVGSPVAGGGYVCWLDGYGSLTSPLRYYKLPEKADAPFKPAIKGAALEVPETARHVVPSPLYHDGLIYVCGNSTTITRGGGKRGVEENMILFVCDVLTEKVVYSKNLDFGNEPLRNDRPYGCGMAASPAIAGGKIFLVGNFGTTLILEPGREYKEVGRNTIDQRISYYYKEDRMEGTVGNLFFDGNKIFYRAQRHLYCIGEPEGTSEK